MKHSVLLHFVFLAVATACVLSAVTVPADLSGYRPGPITVERQDESLRVTWRDEADAEWRAVFSLDPDKPIIRAIGSGGENVVVAARPYYHAETGKRSKGWDAFFDYPPNHPEGTRPARASFHLRSARVRTIGDRVELYFDGMRMGIFDGGLAYTIFPGSRLIQQEAVLTTYVANTAYYYDAGLEFSAPADVQPGRNMRTEFFYYDTEGKLRQHIENGLQPERQPVKVRHRTLAAKSSGGAIAVFPAPHQYFIPRDFTSNLGHLWYRAWHGRVSLGIRQIRDTNWQLYPWANAPPGTQQRMSVFFLLSNGTAKPLLEDVLEYTHRDRYPHLDGYRTLNCHYHLDYTVQALQYGPDWVPPFKPVMQAMGVDASIIMDFHIDGHPRDLTDLRLSELAAFYEACRRQSNEDFLLIPSEEANVHYGGHYSVIFPKPVYWFMKRPAGGAFETTHPKYGKVYSVANAQEMLDLVRRENGWSYQSHPRTKGSTGYPDKIRGTEHYLDPTNFGAGWKSMPVDYSSPRLSERAFKLLDDMNNWGQKKRLLGEVDVFQFDHTHELYAHSNINYVKVDHLPDFDNYDEILAPLREGNFFVSTGEILLPETEIQAASSNQITVRAKASWTFPLRMAEVVWGDGKKTERLIIPLDETRPFGSKTFEWTVPAKDWKWARLAVWDIATNGAFVNPTWRK